MRWDACGFDNILVSNSLEMRMDRVYHMYSIHGIESSLETFGINSGHWNHIQEKSLYAFEDRIRSLNLKWPTSIHVCSMKNASSTLYYIFIQKNTLVATLILDDHITFLVWSGHIHCALIIWKIGFQTLSLQSLFLLDTYRNKRWTTWSGQFRWPVAIFCTYSVSQLMTHGSSERQQKWNYFNPVTALRHDALKLLCWIRFSMGRVSLISALGVWVASFCQNNEVFVISHGNVYMFTLYSSLPCYWGDLYDHI